MVNSEIEKEVEDLFRYFGVKSEPEFTKTPSSLSPDDKLDLPGSDDKQRPNTWKGKWDYIYKKPTWGTYRLPTEGGILSKHHPVSQGGFATPTHPQGHEGLDIANEPSTPIYAIGPGVVKKIYKEDNKGGNAVLTEHEGGRLTSYYAHLDTIDVNVGDEVDQSTQIGTMGKTGNARGSVHLHWHIRLDGVPISPGKITGQPIGYLEKEASRQERLTKLARRYRLVVWERLILQHA
jgi:murein DD-endopeptidase MepM/ murein hydrolase activator NlpD